MKRKKWLIALLCGVLLVSGLAFTACSENKGKPNGNGNQGSLEDDGWTGIY